MRTPTKKEDTSRQYWLWVTKPEYYLENNGDERSSLDPAIAEEGDGWWTCHKDTKRGDLIFLWRTSPKIDIGYLFTATSDAFPLSDDDFAVEHGWDYGCEYLPLFKFNNPITKKDIDDDNYLVNWGAYRGRFQRRVFKIPTEHWIRLNKLAVEKNPNYSKFIADEKALHFPEKIILEEQLEEKLLNDLSILSKHGYQLTLYRDKHSGRTGRQLVCAETRGRIDLLCFDKARNSFVVVELKVVRASENTFGQVCRYMGWVQERIAKGRNVEGLVISKGKDINFEMAQKIIRNVNQINIDDLALY